jgi:Mrp family chromosome partitioning ATPase
MGDIDQALARAYARRTPPELPGTPPPPHFTIEPPPRLANPGAELEWPATVRALERQHGDRFERLADTLIELRDRQGVRSLYAASCHRSEGRTTLVLGLARALARREGRTVLVDADLTGPMLARSLGLRPLVGLDDVLEHGVALAEALIDAPDDHLSILPLRAPVSRPREALNQPAWTTALARLRHEFDSVLIDGGPLFSGMSTTPLPRGVDAAILVRNPALTGRRALLRAREVLETAGIPLLGMAETFV